MRFLAIPHEQMPAKFKAPKGQRSRISILEGWNSKDVKDIAKSKRSGLIKYNNSISLLKRRKKYCTYLMSYRATLPCGTKGKRPKAPREKPYKLTMWDTDWNLCWDGVGFCIIKVFEDGRIEVSNDMIPVKETSYVLDARLVFWRDSFHLIYNRYHKKGYFPNSNPELENCANYGGEGLCIIMETHPIRVTKKGVYSDGTPRILCRDKHSRFEKNWSIVLPVEKKRLVHYSFTPQMKFLEGDHKLGDEEKDTCTWRVSPNSDFFMKLFGYYKSVLPPLVANGIAVTTPLADFDKDHYIGIGRIKIDYKKVSLKGSSSFGDSKKKSPKGSAKGSALKESKLYKFMNLLRVVLNIPDIEPSEWYKYSKAIHASLLYFSFFYTVNKKTLAIGQFSPAYLPQCPDVDYFASITFPMAIQPFTRGKFAISLGISDIDCGIITVSREEIRKMLIYTNRTKPSDFDFQIQSFQNPLEPFRG